MHKLLLTIGAIIIASSSMAQFSIGKISSRKTPISPQLLKVHNGNLLKVDYITLNKAKNIDKQLVEEEYIEFPTSEGSFILKRTDVLQSATGTIWKGDIVGGEKGYGNIFYFNGYLSGTVYLSGKVFKLDAQSQDESRLVEILKPADDLHNCGISSPSKTDSVVLKPSQMEEEEKPSNGNTQIDVMVLYPPSIESSMGGAQAMEAEVNYRIAETNQVFANSQINITFNLVHHQSTTAVKSTASSASDVLVSAVESLRNQYNADIVSHWNDGGSAGSGFNLDGGGDPDDGYNTSNFSDVQSRYTFIHECGHNMGAKHDRQTYYNKSSTSSKLNVTPYYRYGKSFIGYRSVMSYASCAEAGGSNSNCDRVPYFTNPDILVNGAPFGVDGNYQTYNPNGPANNARRLNETASIVAAWRIGVQIDYYDLTVTNGVGTGNYEEGQNVVVVADNPPAGKVFERWDGDVNYLVDRYASTTTITIPNKDVSLTAVYRLMTHDDEVSIQIRINASNDDVEESGDGSGTVYSTSSDLEMTLDGSKGNQTIGLFFRDVGVPTNMDIKSAVIEFIGEGDNSEATALNISAENNMSPKDFSSDAFDVGLRLTTVSSISWNPSSWSTESVYETPNLTPVFQELIEQQGWQQGNDIVVIIEGTGVRSAYSFDGDPNKAALLKLTYKLRNEAPELIAVTNQSTTINTPLEITLGMVTASDPEGQALSIVIEDGENYSVVNNQVIPDQGFVGELDVIIRVTDGEKQSNSKVMKVTVSSITSTNSPNIFLLQEEYLVINSLENFEVKIYTIEGKLMQLVTNENRINLQRLNLSPGIYLAKAISKKKKETVIFIIK